MRALDRLLAALSGVDDLVGCRAPLSYVLDLVERRPTTLLGVEVSEIARVFHQPAPGNLRQREAHGFAREPPSQQVGDRYPYPHLQVMTIEPTM